MSDVATVTKKKNLLPVWTKMRKAVIAAKSIDEIKPIRDKAEAIRYALVQANEGQEVIKQAEEIKLRAERRAGQFLSKLNKEPGKRTDKSLPDKDLTSRDPHGRLSEFAKALKGANIDSHYASVWQREGRLAEEDFKRYVSEADVLSTAGLLRFCTPKKQKDMLVTTVLNNCIKSLLNINGVIEELIANREHIDMDLWKSFFQEVRRLMLKFKEIVK